MARSRTLPAMLALLTVTAIGVFGYVEWLEQRRRPRAPPPPGPVPVSVPATPRDTAPAPAGSLHRCVSPGQPAMYTAEACPAGTTLDRQIEIATMAPESAETRKARQRCEEGQVRRRIELTQLGARRTAADDRLWGDFAARECAEYTARAK